MLIMRPIQTDDLDQLVELASMTSFGLTSLPKDRQLLRRRIEESEHAFRKNPAKPGGELYLFVMEDVENHLLVGTSSIVSKIGGFEPFYAYRLETEFYESTMLNVKKKIQTLHLIREHNGPTEIGSLFLRPSHRHSGNGRLLALSRFLFMAQHRERFEETVIAEMRGVIDERGQSDFWDALGRKFFNIDFPDADYFSVVDKRFIAELMPTHPIYVALLSPAAQQVIGQVHGHTRPALNMLQNEGFQFADMVDIFEAGPIVSCHRDEIRAVRDAGIGEIAELSNSPMETPPFVISRTQDGFRAAMGALTAIDDKRVKLERRTAEALDVKVGDTVRYVTIHPPKTSSE